GQDGLVRRRHGSRLAQPLGRRSMIPRSKQSSRGHGNQVAMAIPLTTIETQSLLEIRLGGDVVSHFVPQCPAGTLAYETFQGVSNGLCDLQSRTESLLCVFELPHFMLD